MKNRAKRDPLKKPRTIAWILLFVIIVGAVYFLATPPSRPNQCENLPANFTVGNHQVKIGTANIEVYVDELILRPFTRDSFGYVTYLTPQVNSGKVILNQLDTVQELRDTYEYSLAYFPTTQFYRGSIITEAGSVQDAVYFIERTNISYIDCLSG